MAKKNLVLSFVLLFFTTAASATVYPVAPFVAINGQGRPLVGGTVSVTDSMGVPVTVYSDPAGTVTYNGIVPATGVVQFFGAVGDYIVTVSAQGSTRQYYINIPVGTGGLTDSDFSGTGWMRKISSNTYSTVKVNLAATVAPTTSDDSSAGYSVGSIWIDITNNTVYFCSSATVGFAHWVSVGASVTSINTKTGDIDLVTSTTGSDFTITTFGGGTILFNLPSMGTGVTRGLLTNSAQEIPGIKTFDEFAFFQNNIIVNLAQHTTNSVFETSGYNSAVTVFGADDQVGFFNAGALPATTRLYGESLTTDDVFYMYNGNGGNALHAFTHGSAGGGAAVYAIAESGSTGEALEADSTSANALAGQFLRSVASATVPVARVRRNISTDSQDLLKLEDVTSSTTGTYAVEYTLNGTVKNGLRTNGQVVAVSGSTPGLSFIGDEDTGIGNPSSGLLRFYSNGATVCDLDSTFLACAVGVAATGDITATGNAVISGEIKVGGVTGTGKTVCVKSDANFGVCSDQPNGSGICTCG